MDILQNVMDSSSHAMFTMDRQGIVTHINQQAKERFGLFNHSLYAHSAGRLEPGDLVILATTAMGADDGNLTPEDLAVVGNMLWRREKLHEIHRNREKNAARLRHRARHRRGG